MKSTFQLASLVLLACALVSCHSTSATPAAAPTPPPPAPKPKVTIATSAGSIVEYPVSGPRNILWQIRYKNAQLTFTGDAPDVGKMSDVSGEIFQDNEVKSFRADNAEGDRASQVLTLTGHVSVYSPKEDANLKCDKLVYHAAKKMFSASGNVSVINRRYSLNGLSEAVADSSLSEVATPDMFEAKSEKK